MANDNSDIVLIGLDDNRRTIGGDSDNQAVSWPAVKMAEYQMHRAMGDGTGKRVIFDATNMHRKARKRFLKIARQYNAQRIAIVFECTKETLLARNAARGAAGGRNVSESAIDAMLGRYQRPEEITEFDTVTFISKLP
jgi:predicted kinase